ncbi:MAG TPA: SAM-dependent chlorinase/fluorinase [Candidatus Dormibacteraeota bacterium]|nr:SAM-dependent chlorinase/fluorinase [Candidatus Dormibacteraeota bacterium]
MVLITLLSDFGLDDPYLAQMKGVIASIVPDIGLIDISHGIEKHNIAIGSYVLETTVPLFPHDSIHVAVVDPGVGGARLPIVIECDRGVLVGPDNGLMARAAARLGLKTVYQIKSNQFQKDQVSSTFHGRDVFAIAAARLAEGRKPSDVGPEQSTIVRLDIPSIGFMKERVRCNIIYIDSFGNVVTNISDGDLHRHGFQDSKEVEVLTRRGRKVRGLVARSYSDIPTSRFGLLVGSQGYVEIALKEASAAKKLRVKVLDPLEIRFS